MPNSSIERILILAKTYPSPSSKYMETSCVAGITDKGLMRRLYPVPFRLLEGAQQFSKWQWINVRTIKAPQDHRKESYRLFVDTLACGEKIESKQNWAFRRYWLEQIPSFDSFGDIERSRIDDGLSLSLLRPKKVFKLEIAKAKSLDWTPEEKEKLLCEQTQDDLFSQEDAERDFATLRKVPFDFYYHYLCDTAEGEKEYHHKIVDWEACALYWNCVKKHGSNWEVPFRAGLEDKLISKDLMFLMGNQHRFQHQWLIISMIYPPKPQPQEVTQFSLF
ncbi:MULTISPECIES: hypothetical protein [Methylomonas]|uniref:Uncharacterized protein n=2 Tax=Methylomonas TaxID=416 RepID=A0A126T4G7_9GAMM|nr:MULTISPECIES: hypothetical protein [Methylomonas]AMK76983.1 hypothetical protein JT25_010865 [Methylomonas denitrificans]OAH98011.1 hypothetical protein A1342_20075 [Methylomonas methanica]TCV81162.1 hypothetical protein EDE11_11650 [Methylomonas methanica]